MEIFLFVKVQFVVSCTTCAMGYRSKPEHWSRANGAVEHEKTKKNMFYDFEQTPNVDRIII